MTALTSKQSAILETIRAYMRDNAGRAPTFREIAQVRGLKSTCTVMRHLQALEKKGFIERDRYVYRGIRIPDAPDISDLHATLLELAEVIHRFERGQALRSEVTEALENLVFIGWRPQGSGAGGRAR